MTNDATRASAIALPEISRRRMLADIAVFPVCGLAVIAPTVAVAIPQCDPLLDAIQAYRGAVADFEQFASLNSEGEADAYAEVSYLPPMEVLEDWDEPARTKEGALEAIRFAIRETTMFEASAMVLPVLTAALAYFELEGGAI